MMWKFSPEEERNRLGTLSSTKSPERRTEIAVPRVQRKQAATAG